MKKVKLPTVFSFVFLLLSGAHLFLIWDMRVYPFVDLPNHLSAATIYRYYGESGNEFSKYFVLDLFPKPNVVHILFCGSKLFPSVETANRIYYAAYILLFPLSVLLLIRKVNGNSWFSLLVFPLLYNFSVSWGLAEYTLSIPFVLLTLLLALSSLEQERWILRIVLGVLLLLLFFMHAQASIYALLIYMVWCLAKYRTDISKILINSIVSVPLVLMIGIWWFRETSEFQGPNTTQYLSAYYLHNYLPTFGTRIKYLLSNDNTFLFDGKIGSLVALFFFSGIVCPPMWWMFRRTYKSKVPWEANDSYVFGLSLVTLAFFLFLPEALPEHAFIYHRFSVYFLIAMILTGSILFRRIDGGKTVALICILCAIHFGLYADYFQKFKQETRQFTERLFPDPEPRQKLGGLIYKYRFRGGPSYIHFQNYYIIWKKGIASTAIIDYRFGTVRRKETEDPIPRYLRLDFVGMNDNYDGRYSDIDYILVRGDLSQDAKRFMGQFEVRNPVGDWTLYRNTRIPEGTGVNTSGLAEAWPGNQSRPASFPDKRN